jgi:quercetin 2,3-dioxygenase
MKIVLGRYGNEQGHWVGDGFPVRSLFSYVNLGQHLHRGFETVTIVYDGEVEHRDSTGRGGIIGPGNV